MCTKNCVNCGKEFFDKSDAQSGKYCSHKCNNAVMIKADRINRDGIKIKCELCGIKFGIGKYMFGKAKYCSVICNKRAYYLKKQCKGLSKLIDKNHKDYINTPTGMGEYREKITHLATGRHWNNEFISTSIPDLTNNGITYDVKSNKGYERKQGGKQWSFACNNKIVSEYYILILIDNNNPVAVYMVPSNFIPEKGRICLGKNSKKYKDYKDDKLLLLIHNAHVNYTI